MAQCHGCKHTDVMTDRHSVTQWRVLVVRYVTTICKYDCQCRHDLIIHAIPFVLQGLGVCISDQWVSPIFHQTGPSSSDTYNFCKKKKMDKNLQNSLDPGQKTLLRSSNHCSMGRILLTTLLLEIV